MDFYETNFLFLIIFFSHSIDCSVPEEIIESIESIVSIERKIPIIAIAGCSGIGKSTFATFLSKELAQRNIRAIIFSLDDFGKTLEEKKELKNELDIMWIRWDDLHSVLEEIRLEKKRIQKPKVNQLTKERTEEILNLDEVDLILFEGIYTLSSEVPINLLSYVDLGIYMETTTENIYQWKWEREKKKSVPRTLDQFKNHMALIFEDFVRFVYPTKQNANWIVFANDQHEFTARSSKDKTK